VKVKSPAVFAGLGALLVALVLPGERVAGAQVPNATPPSTTSTVDPEPTPDTSTPDVGPVGEAHRPLWYEPYEGEGSAPPPPEYRPIAVILEPQVLTGGARGGLVTTLQVNVPFGPAAGFLAGLQVADSPRLIAGFDFFRYLGREVGIAKIGGLGPVTAVFAPTVVVEGFVNASAAGGDVSLQPFGVRSVIAPMKSMFEIRLAGHVLYGGELGSFGGGVDSLARPSAAGTLGLVVVWAPLLFERTEHARLKSKRRIDDHEARIDSGDSAFGENHAAASTSGGAP
jgi:hypothetical protein